MELTLTQMFAIALLLGAAYLLAKLVRYATLEEAEKKRLRDKVDELTDRIDLLQRYDGRDNLPPKFILPIENSTFLTIRAGDLIDNAIEHLVEARKKQTVVEENLADVRGLNKSYKTGERNGD